MQPEERFNIDDLAFEVTLPSTILLNRNLDASAVRLYGFIKGLTKLRGYCYSSNAYLSFLVGVKERQIQNLLKSLSEEGFIEVDTDKTGIHWQRRIYLGVEFKKSLRNATGCIPPRKSMPTPMQCIASDIRNIDNQCIIEEEREKSAPPPPLAPPPKEIISYKKLSLEKERLGKLIDKFGKDTVMEMCDELDNYADIYPKKFKAYACHVAVLTSWLSRKTSDGPNSLSKASNLIQRLKDKAQDFVKAGVEINDLYVDFKRHGEYYRISDKTFVQDVIHSLRKRGATPEYLKYLEMGD